MHQTNPFIYQVELSVSTHNFTASIQRNLQGDITAVYSETGTKLVSYTYDAWGNHVVTPYNDGENIIAVANNPIRYRGYYYDTDLGLYYLQTRYYDSNIGRFINADGYISTGTGILGYNMYAYCNNNPVMYVDPSGEIIILIAIVVVVLVTLTSCSSQDNQIADKPPQSVLNENTSFGETPEYLNNNPNNSLDVTISLDDVHNWSNDNDKVKQYTDLLADYIEDKYATYLDGNKIDRVQLYSEIKFHIVSWDIGFMTDKANPINLNIYSSGKVIDPRPRLNDFVRGMYGGEYNE